MKSTLRMGIAAAGATALALALAACGNSDDASEDATAESVEVTADEAMEQVTEEPVEDTAVAAPEPVEEPEISEVEIKSNTQQSEEAQELADQIKAELAGTGGADDQPAPAEQAEQ